MDSKCEYNDMEPGFADLPMEIIVNIFRYLNFYDVQSASLACRRWLEASRYSEFQRKVTVSLSKLCVSDKLEPVLLFLNSQRSLRSICFEETTFATVDNFMERIGKTVKNLIFDNVDLTERQFCGILKNFSHLKSLTITRCSPLFMAGQFLESPADLKSIAETMSGVHILSLKFNQYLSDAILMRLTSLIAKLHTLDMSGCHIAYHSAIQRRFYPEEMANNPSESILTFKFILHVIQQHQATLEELNFSMTLIGGSAMSALSEVKGLKLRTLLLNSCRQLNVTGIGRFLETQSSLVHVDLSDTISVTDDCIVALVETAINLEKLNIKGCSKVTNIGLLALARVTKLKSLNISRCDGITSEGVIQGIAKVPNKILRELYMSHVNLCEECVKLCAYNLIELRVLDVGNCINGVTDQSMQAVIQNLTWLQDLSLEDCFRITDAALTGINVEAQLVTGNKNVNVDSSMENFHSNSSLSAQLSSLKISVRSKAEEEIVRDARRKEAMLAIHELNLTDSSCQVVGASSINQLKGLRSLNLKGCHKISDVSLKFGFKFIELRRLLLSKCQQVSVVGIEQLVRNCPSLEEFDLSDCYNINDKAIEIITIHLKRLKALHLSGCNQLTDRSLDSILTNCHVLQTLTVYRSRRMYFDVEDRLADLSSIRSLFIDNSPNMDNAFRMKKRLDY